MTKNIFVIFLFLLIGCAAPEAEANNGNDHGTIAGVYFFGRETNALIQCSTNDRWFVDSNHNAKEELMNVYASEVDVPYGNLYALLHAYFQPLPGNADYVGIFYLLAESLW
ncbi:MAG: hypothetical protein IIA98_06925 [Proteobacteria bacterium]|nr:hypothetical protein [Pseudomonadota bacterium]